MGVSRPKVRKTVRPSVSIKTTPYKKPLLFDLDGDGRFEVVSIEPTLQDPTDLSLTVRSADRDAVLWAFEFAHPGLEPFDRYTQWPSIVDLDDDGKDEVVLPVGENIDPFGEDIDKDRFLMKIHVLEGMSGTERWAKTIHLGRRDEYRGVEFKRVPDLDGDGLPDVVVAAYTKRKPPPLDIFPFLSPWPPEFRSKYTLSVEALSAATVAFFGSDPWTNRL